ncbi:hypothetical protein OESDEN_04620 [Oesophagostomum dentatum]|uniref:Uncharacterized protein n=1 Tax=Oesophagostomum dentatum TaxID=61180 RepID=A0A0B1THX0_OESDE|nr:hypothetical protein OESDEN_04620 [Oesophagostomum dentatum]
MSRIVKTLLLGQRNSAEQLYKNGTPGRPNHERTGLVMRARKKARSLLKSDCSDTQMPAIPTNRTGFFFRELKDKEVVMKFGKGGCQNGEACPANTVCTIDSTCLKDFINQPNQP